MIELPEEALRILHAKSFPVVSVVDERGRPRLSAVWVTERDGRVLINTTEARVKGRLLTVGAPVSLLTYDPEDSYHYFEIRGVVGARTTEGADDDINALARKYRGKDFTFDPAEQRVTILIEPERVFEYGR